jgi:hypothetical protein
MAVIHRGLALRIKADMLGNWRTLHRIRVVLQVSLVLLILEIFAWLLSIGGFREPRKTAGDDPCRAPQRNAHAGQLATVAAIAGWIRDAARRWIVDDPRICSVKAQDAYIKPAANAAHREKRPLAMAMPAAMCAFDQIQYLN